MIKKLSASEIAANKARLARNVRAWLVFWGVVFLAVFWLSGYAKGLFDGESGCHIFQSRCTAKQESKS